MPPEGWRRAYPVAYVRIIGTYTAVSIGKRWPDSVFCVGAVRLALRHGRRDRRHRITFSAGLLLHIACNGTRRRATRRATIATRPLKSLMNHSPSKLWVVGSSPTGRASQHLRFFVPLSTAVAACCSRLLHTPHRHYHGTDCARFPGVDRAGRHFAAARNVGVEDARGLVDRVT